MNDHVIVKAMSTPVAHYVCVDVFKKALQALTIEEQIPQLLEPAECFPPANRSVVAPSVGRPEMRLQLGAV